MSISSNLYTEYPNEWPSMTITYYVTSEPLGFLTAYPKPKSYLSSIFKVYSKLSWFLFAIVLVCISTGFLMTYAVYRINSPQLIRPDFNHFDAVFFKTWLGFTESPTLDLFSNVALTGYHILITHL